MVSVQELEYGFLGEALIRALIEIPDRWARGDARNASDERSVDLPRDWTEVERLYPPPPQR